MNIKPPNVPSARHATLRQAIIALLRDGAVSAQEISVAVGLSVREVPGHLEHIRHSLRNDKLVLEVLPAECRHCGFVFAKRDRLGRPGRCPVCRGQSIGQPRYLVTDGE